MTTRPVRRLGRCSVFHNFLYYSSQHIGLSQLDCPIIVLVCHITVAPSVIYSKISPVSQSLALSPLYLRQSESEVIGLFYILSALAPSHSLAIQP